MICKGYTEANNKFLKSYDPNKPASYIIYLDANNWYRHFMKELLLTEVLDWVNLKDFNLGSYSNDSPKGCFLEVKFDYPLELPHLHNDHPLAGEKMKVVDEILSKYQLQIVEDNNFSPGKNQKYLLLI